MLKNLMLEGGFRRKIGVAMRRATVALALLVALASSPGSAVAETELEVGYIPILPMAQLFVMEGEGWTKEAGLKLKLIRFSSGPAMTQALASGSMDVAYIGIGPAMVARANGIDIKVVAANGREQVAVIAHGGLAEIFASGGTVREAFAAFHKKTGRPAKLATLPKGSVPDTVLRYWLVKVHGVDAGDVEILGMGTDQVQQALLSGAVEGASILEPILTIVRERMPTARIIAPGDEMLPNQPGAILAVRERALAAHPDAIAKLVELHVRATDLIQADPARATKHILAIIGQGLIEEETILKAISANVGEYIADPSVIFPATRVMHDFQAELGTLAKPVPLDELFRTDLYEAARKRLK